MSRTIRTAAAVVAAVAATTLAAATTAAADPGTGGNHGKSATAHERNQIRKETGVKGRIELGTPVASLPGAPEGSQRYTSDTYTMGKGGDTNAITAMCPSGSYVEYLNEPQNGLVGPVVTVNSDSIFVTNAIGYPYGTAPIDESIGQYQGFVMKLSNDNPFYSNTGSFSWNCISL